MALIDLLQTKRISIQKLAANRANAKQSTGPKSLDGKTRSRQNAAKHGLRSRLYAIETLGETAEENLALKNMYVDKVQPRNPEELFLTELLFKQHLNLRRLGRFEAGAIESAARDCASQSPDDHAVLCGETYLATVKNGDPVEKTNKMEQRILRIYTKAQDHLDLLRRRNVFNEEKFAWPDQDTALTQAAAQLEADDKRWETPENAPIEPTTPIESTQPPASATPGPVPATPEPVVPIDQVHRKWQLDDPAGSKPLETPRK